MAACTCSCSLKSQFQQSYSSLPTYWATRVGLSKFEIFPINDGSSGNFSRAVAMPYGATWNALAEQNALNGIGNAMLLDAFLATVEPISRELPEIPKEL